ncbi:UDP-N-acetylmuramate dehydrogenase [Acidaminobacter hydrogenoformans]|uniref:UDP-N-acetylenolpyruvoylglucosamine reductase n=1 Tax=Acidaminobacter hydrogenoformans DSM 2784 TaxID=1120920 RepID=A0A1G5S0P0_9FIRM|nr:UDP-N-acetylmuramate dehydrogenase [Acidaminobacter hydrogenoformans]SCZ79932.1 UDP-N-acetylmuramate dehydrogenase [Acidaminobacter hydrogenoformans DSM 2784]
MTTYNLNIEYYETRATEMINKLLETLTRQEVKASAPLSALTSFKIGGPADVLIEPATVEGAADAISTLKDAGYPYMVIGNGSNLLFSDKGYRGAILRIADNLTKVEINETRVVAEAGILLSKLASQLMDRSLAGFEFASGIPGTLGGAVYMNAGAYDGEMKDVVEWADVLMPNGKIETLDNATLGFSYRHSRIMEAGGVVLRVGLKLNRGMYEDIKAKTDDLTEKRTSKQPLEKASAGSTFKRPEGHFAGKLIEDAGLRGLSYGKAQVSPKHCGFIVNNGGATAAEVLHLINVVRKTVRDIYGVTLEPEVRIIPEVPEQV